MSSLCNTVGCGKAGDKRCPQCKSAFYCDEKCQRKDWKEHKAACKAIKKKETEGLGFGGGTDANEIKVKNSAELVDAMNLIKARPTGDKRRVITLEKGTYTSPATDFVLEVPADEIKLFRGANMKRKSSCAPGDKEGDWTILDMEVKVVASSAVPEESNADMVKVERFNRKRCNFNPKGGWEFHMQGMSVKRGMEIDTGDHIPRMKLQRVHVERDRQNDCCIITKARKVLLDDCEVFGGGDGLFINSADVYIYGSDIRFAASRGIFANPNFRIEDSEVSNCGGYGIKCRGGYDDIGDNDLQPGLWNEFGGPASGGYGVFGFF